MRIKKLFKDYQKATKAADKAEKIMMDDIENEEAEKAFDKAYEKQWKAFTALQEEIVNLIGIPKSTAATMIRMKEKELEALVNRIA